MDGFQYFQSKLLVRGCRVNGVVTSFRLYLKRLINFLCQRICSASRRWVFLLLHLVLTCRGFLLLLDALLRLTFTILTSAPCTTTRYSAKSPAMHKSLFYVTKQCWHFPGDSFYKFIYLKSIKNYFNVTADKKKFKWV